VSNALNPHSSATEHLVSLPTITVDGLVFRDLDHDGVLAPYEDWRLSAAQRANDLVARMSLAEKAGLMVHGTAPSIGPLGLIGVGTEYDPAGIKALVVGSGVTSLITRLNPRPVAFATQNNSIQTFAAQGRLGIPVTISSDPRHHCGQTLGASVESTGFSQWPDTLGFGALDDEVLVERFGDVVRQEYRAVGIHMALSPQADLATSPRWPRIDGTFGDDPALVRKLVGAYVRGIQSGRSENGRPSPLGANSVAAVVKHWVGYGASRDGFDGHNWYGRYSAFPSGKFGDHIEAFLDAFAVGVSGVMPTYNILEDVVLGGEPLEAVGAGFSRQLLMDLLRGVYGYEGIILSDWGITRDITESCRTGVPTQTPEFIAMPWGVEDLSHVEKFAKTINAGVDQIGGENDPGPIVEAVTQGLVSMERIDDAVRRILTQKFELGLFDNPFVDAHAAPTVVGSAGFVVEGLAAQRSALTLLKGERGSFLSAEDIVFVDGLDPAVLAAHNLRITTDLSKATVAVLKFDAPFETLHPNHFFGSRQHEGRLDFADDHPALMALLTTAAVTRTVVIIGLDRPAVLTPIVELATTVLASFGATDAAILEVLLGNASPDGRLPFALPSSMAEAIAQTCDGADETRKPLFARSFSV
jgi:beta-glucosidase